MRRSAAEWNIRPSQRQRSLDLAAAGILTFTVGFIDPLYLFVLVPILILALLPVNKARVTRVGVDDEGWWIQSQGQKRPVVWRSGSQRQANHIFLVWGFWPWQTLHLNADSLTDDDDFRRLKMALYGSL